jgi:hypothetical protein
MSSCNFSPWALVCRLPRRGASIQKGGTDNPKRPPRLHCLVLLYGICGARRLGAICEAFLCVDTFTASFLAPATTRSFHDRHTSITRLIFDKSDRRVRTRDSCAVIVGAHPSL